MSEVTPLRAIAERGLDAPRSLTFDEVRRLCAFAADASISDRAIALSGYVALLAGLEDHLRAGDGPLCAVTRADLARIVEAIRGLAIILTPAPAAPAPSKGRKAR